MATDTMTIIFTRVHDKLEDIFSPSSHHLAAVVPSKGSTLQIAHRPTPTPGPVELLIEVKSIALNPVDHYMRDSGYAITSYPAVLGSDIAGTVLAAGSLVPPTAFKPGTRIAAFAQCFFVHGEPAYGAFQQRVLVPAVNAVPLPESMSFNGAAVLPMAVTTAWAGFGFALGVPRDVAWRAEQGEGVLIWGGASSVGSAAVQVARLLGFKVYVTASERHHAYMKCLGASRAFEYKDEDVVERIVRAVKEDGVSMRLGFDAVGHQMQSSIEVLKRLNGGRTAKLASAARIPAGLEEMEGVKVTFVRSPEEEMARMDFFHFVFNVWLRQKLEKGQFIPSPKIQIVGKGLGSVQEGLDVLKKGVSGVKLVVET
ncbi:uncharacterized protein K452DRAFT_288480 [Aplosporella prunicola CBS 121167]|uniref:Enoyl reductase (ER) domain-containing protein n=1 Tax=Aplosporella prunicola CBS 121167 TaxID=1176127 RepID=A0A6A6BAQ9_9PEZI|nr:uncharacterized protein K452DRAFT_288480 [Aplosporella prunicola CBS 121167]KAF2141106.1 hypothetical protein K452DRAFT_288480 [Aplosporella prunicola CBS 121167]